MHARGAVLAASVLLAATGASAATCVGSCGSLTANGDVTAPPGGGAYGWISTFGGVDGVGQLPSVGGTDGSTFTTSAFDAAAGDSLTYNFNFVSSDGQNGADGFIYEDYAFVQLVDADSGNLIAMLFNARTEPGGLISPGLGLPPVDPGVTLTPPTSPITLGTGDGGGPRWTPLGDYSGQCWGPGCGVTGWIGSNYKVASDGTYKLVFGVTNWGDNIYDTGLAFSGIMVGDREIEDHEAIPEPAAWAMMLLGFFGMGAVLRRQSARAASAV